MSRAVAENFIDRLTDYCDNLATLPGLMGRERSELRPAIRSTTFGNYVIFMRYLDWDGPRSHLAIVNVIHGARDMDAYFAAHPDDDTT
jgi:toxin ParE1/3/4